MRYRTTYRPLRKSFNLIINHLGNPESGYYGEVLVFTGNLDVRLREAADVADAIGSQVAAVVPKEHDNADDR